MLKSRLNKLINNALYIGCLAGITSPAIAAKNSEAISTLLSQASYWHTQSRDDLAISTLKRVLNVDVNNINALYLMALYEMQQGNKKEAIFWKKRLAALSPDDPRLASLQSEAELKSINSEQLVVARELAKNGKVKEAIVAYKTLFPSGKPTDALALEYYQTLAGDKETIAEAIIALKQRAQVMPADRATRLALATVLTYQTDTRRAGIQSLSALAPHDKNADEALRQALLWLEANENDLALYKNYAERHPNDKSVMSHFRSTVAGVMTGQAYSNLNDGKLSEAKAGFKQVLQKNSSDGKALAGLGYIALRQKRFDDAADYLQKAADSGGKNRTQWLAQAQNARFYSKIQSIKILVSKKNYTDALSQLAEIPAVSGDKNFTVESLKADIYTRTGDFSETEKIYRKLLKQQPENTEIRSALYFALKQMGKTREAENVLKTLPTELQKKYAPTGDPAAPIRKKAAEVLAAGDTAQARAILQNGVKRYPDNIWLLLDLARILRDNGEGQNATTMIMQRVQQQNISADNAYAVALFASEQNDWITVQSLLARVPANVMRKDIRALQEQVRFNRQLTAAQTYLQQGNQVAASNTLRALMLSPPDHPAELGRLAQAVMESGDLAGALQLVHKNIANGLHGSVGEYAGQINVLNQAGLFNEAENILNSPSLQNTESAQEILKIRTGNIIATTDALREEGRISEAYDKLMPALQQDLENSDLLLAMARIYQSNNRLKKAQEIYDYVLRKSPRNQQALEGKVNLALAYKEFPSARQSFLAITPSRKPEYLLLAARVAAAEGNNQKALRLLNSAKQAQSKGNFPIRNTVRTLVNPMQVNQYEYTMPNDEYLNTVTTASKTQQEIYRMLDELKDKTGTQLQAGAEVRERNGERGLSRLTETRSPIHFSFVPGETNRVDLAVTPVSLNSGGMNAESARRFGTGALSYAKQPTHNHGLKDNSANLDSLGVQQGNGVEANLSLSGNNYKIDLGTTPLGALNSSVVGGLEWAPNLTENSSLNLKAERRAVTDSILSYVGAKDKNTGEVWGAVTRNGGSVQYSYDDNLIGFYSGIGAYSYLGKNVPSNKELRAFAGTYLRAYKTNDSELRIGVNANHMDFEKNLSYFSLGHGGYFSPQNYMAVSLPIIFNQKTERWDVTVKGSVGYQSFRKDESDYFPGYLSQQKELDGLAESDEYIDSIYKREDSNGTGYTLGVDAKYKLFDNVQLGTKLGYDTFGNYSEAKGFLYLKYHLNSEE